MSIRPKLRKQYPKESIQAAVLSVQEEKMTTGKAAVFYGVPYSTLKDHMKRGKSFRKPQVEKTALSSEQEERLVSWLEESARRGFRHSKKQIFNAVQRIVKDTAIKTPFKDGRPGRKWFKNFMSRHKEKLSIRTRQGLGSMRAAVTANKIKDWFKGAYNKIIADDPDLLNHPERIFNCDEICFQLAGGISRVSKDKSFDQITHDTHRQINVLVCGSASGEVHQPLLIFPGKRFCYDPLAGFPEAYFAKSESGRINSEIFEIWLQTAFVPAVAHLEKPVILFVDAHESHLSLDVSELCRDHNIILYQLPSHSSHIIQPLDLTTFKALKTAWKEEVFNYQEEECNTLEKRDFSHVLKKAWQRGIKKDIVISGFRAAGIYPWDPDHIDLSKLGRSQLFDPSRSMLTVTVTGAVPEETMLKTETMTETDTQQTTDDNDIVMTETQTPNDNLMTMAEIQKNCDDIVMDDTAIIPLSRPNLSSSIITTQTQTTDTIDNPTAPSSSSLDDNGLSPLIALDRLLDVAAKVGPDQLYEFKILNTLKRQTNDLNLEKQLFSLLYNRLTNMLKGKKNISVKQPDHHTRYKTNTGTHAFDNLSLPSKKVQKGNSDRKQKNEQQPKMINSNEYREHIDNGARKKKEKKEELQKKKKEREFKKKVALEDRERKSK